MAIKLFYKRLFSILQYYFKIGFYGKFIIFHKYGVISFYIWPLTGISQNNNEVTRTQKISP